MKERTGFLTSDEERLDAYGPYPKENREVVVLTVGNDLEAHGCALPPDIDSRNIRAIAQLACQRSGATFLGHLPYSTDSVGDIAVAWSPRYIPYDTFVAKVEQGAAQFVRELAFRPRKVFILNGHGGNRALANENERLSNTVGAPVDAFIPEPGKLDLAGSEAGEALMQIMAAGSAAHAYIMEHSVAAYFGDLDEEKLADMNRVAENDPLEALKRWPAIAGLGGYTEFGGKEYDPLRELKGLLACTEDFKKRRAIIADKQLGEKLVEAVVDLVVQRIEE